ncbi:MAG: fused DSP-PTPase phosphatase/NAD kinase-like protein [Nitrospirota bacterium]
MSARHTFQRLVSLIVFLAFTVGWILLSTDVRAQHVSIPNFHKVYDEVYRGARPREKGIKELKQMGIKTIVNLEREMFEKVPGEVKKERRWAEEAGIKFFHVPLHPFFAPKKEEIEKALAYITDPANHPVFVHCDRGSDRTGIVIAAYRMQVNGWSFEKAYAEMKRYGHRDKLLFWWKKSLLPFKR